MKTATFIPSQPGFWQKAAVAADSLYPGDNLVVFDHFKEAYPYGTFRRMVAVGVAHELAIALGDAKSLQALALDKRKWWVGYISYDAKNAFYPEGLDKPGWDSGLAAHFFSPAMLLLETADGTIEVLGGQKALDLAEAIDTASLQAKRWEVIKAQNAIEFASYETLFNIVQRHLHNGDIYELNLCRPVEYSLSDVGALPHLYQGLTQVSPTPFMYYARLGDLGIAGSSPERFLKHIGGKLVSQPIKGTLARLADPMLDLQQKQKLLDDPKIRAENMMITDLVRNDLMRCCLPGTVEVEELFGAYGFEHVWQLITTIAGTAKENSTLGCLLEATFPMGSMTGAPKRRAIEVIDQLEHMKRGPYSGAIGYQSPGGDFDFAVIIRSLFHNRATGKLWYQTGGAIVADSDAVDEWDELQLKAAALEKVLQAARS